MGNPIDAIALILEIHPLIQHSMAIDNSKAFSVFHKLHIIIIHITCMCSLIYTIVYKGIVNRIYTLI